jgi:hypothetical protein
MTFLDTMRRFMMRAKDEASDVARGASIKLDIRNLEGKREHHLKEIGRIVCAMADHSWRPAEIEPLCSEIANVDRRIAKLQQDLQKLRTRPPRTTEAAANAPSA